MHRSGTSLVTKTLERAGIFMGVVKDHNYEAMHFLSLNQQTLWAAGARWLEPKVPEKIYWKTMPAKVLFHEHFRLSGRWQKLLYDLKPVAWGWKDPRNTFTLPMWLDLFPGAKVLHVTRNKEAVAESLKRRNQGKGEVFDERLNDIDFNLKLAEKYVSQGRSYQKILGERYHEISYEEITQRDEKALQQLEIFTGVQVRKPLEYYLAGHAIK